MIDYRPDHEPDQPGTLTVCNYMFPDKSGNYVTSYSAQASGWASALNGSETCRGARVVRPSITTRLLAGTASKLLEGLSNGTWTDRSSATYSLGASERWWLTSFGDDIIACSPSTATQVATTGAFSALTNAPKAKIILSQSGHLLALNYNDGTAYPAGIKWCSQGVDTTWTASASNSAGTAVLRESQGEITAGAEIHDIVCIWKYRSMYVGKRIGGTEIWRFNLLSPKIGCIGQEAWVSTPVGIIFMAENGVYRFDGSVPQPIDEGVRGNLYRQFGSFTPAIEMTHEEASGCVYFWFGGGVNKTWCYNYLSDKWSVAYADWLVLGSATQSGFEAGVRDLTFADALLYSAYAGDTTDRVAHLIFTSDHKMTSLTYTVAQNGVTPVIQSGRIRHPQAGPDEWTEVTRVVPLFGTKGVTGAAVEAAGTSGGVVLSGYPRISGTGSGITNATATMDTTNKRFDVRQVGNVIQMAWTATNDAFVLRDIGYDMKRAGKR